MQINNYLFKNIIAFSVTKIIKLMEKMSYILIILCMASMMDLVKSKEISVPELSSLVEPCEFEGPEEVGWYRSKVLQNGYCYKWNWDRGAAGTWTGTRFHCRNLSAHLLWFDSTEEFELILQTLRTLINSTGTTDSTGSAEKSVEVYLNAHGYIYNVEGAAWATGDLLNQSRFGPSTDFGSLSCERDSLRLDCYSLNASGHFRRRHCLDSLSARFICKRPENGSLFPGSPLLRPPECSTCTDRTNKFNGSGWLLSSNQRITHRDALPFQTGFNVTRSNYFHVHTKLTEEKYWYRAYHACRDLKSDLYI